MVAAPSTTTDLALAAVGVFLMMLLPHPLGAVVHLPFLALIGGLPGVPKRQAD